MDKSQFIFLEESLLKRGYRKYNQHWHNEDYVIGKGFHKEDNQWEEDRNAYQILLSIYDNTLPHEWNYRLSGDMLTYVGIEIHINVSRSIDERIEMIIPWHNNTTMEEIEKVSEEYFQWICEKWPEPRKEEKV